MSSSGLIPKSRIWKHLLLRKTWVIRAALILSILIGTTWWLAGRSARVIVPVPSINLESCPEELADTIALAIEAVEQHPDSGLDWGHLGMLLFAHQFEFEASQCLEQAGILEPENFRWPYLLGLNKSVSDRNAAADHWRQAIRLNSDLAVAHCRLGELSIDLGQWPEAETHLQAAARMRPNDVRTLVALARLSQLQGQVEEALSRAERAIRLAPDERSPHELVAKLHQQLGNNEAALSELKIAESLPNRPPSWDDPVAAEVVQLRQDSMWYLEKANLLFAEGRFVEGIQVLRDTARRDDQDPRVFSALGRALVQVHQTGEAQAVLLEAASRYPDSPEIAFQLGVAYLAGDQFADAVRSFREAIRVKPDYELAHFNLGFALERTGDLNGALSAFQSAASLRPTHAAAHTNAGRLLLDQGNAGKALEHLNQSVRLEPDNRAARELFQRASAGR